MIKFNTPTNLNGTQIRAELNAAGVKIASTSGAVMMDGNGDLWLDISDKDKSKAENIVLNHEGKDNSKEQIKAKSDLLAKLGITEDEAKLLLS